MARPTLWRGEPWEMSHREARCWYANDEYKPGRGGVVGDSKDKVGRGKMRGRDKTSALESGGEEKIEEC